MSVRNGILALLDEEPMYGARLRAEFEARTGGTWPLNVGQVYTTLARLERDGLVEPLGGSTGPVPAGDEPAGPGGTTYGLTEAGRREARGWWATPVSREGAPRDELVIKLALAVTAPGVDVAQVVQTQRTATLTHLRDLTRLKARVPGDPEAADLAWSLVLEHHLFTAEAEARWLDHVESRLARRAAQGPAPAAVPAPEPAEPVRGGGR
ncbi:PadR family transcriptional regulator [Lapillicoccus jejuensis]|uniref:DNA-binding PadR family transcriptional regulator n=1 Tax=Lapillicoccus jejuensis TaxID=402171 RepID=A0A542DZS3_9MICO|nr:PadR family transcriptional regulator [Lapillicoccus jejuensis]TQJ08580.1 DNA-binding PadR family transcriptional regulator [Lapillicoccus jejuensis]